MIFTSTEMNYFGFDGNSSMASVTVIQYCLSSKNLPHYTRIEWM